MNRILHKLTLISTISCFLLLIVFHVGAFAQQQDIPLKDLSFFDNPGPSWSIVGDATAILEEANQFETESGTGVLINTPANHGKDLLTKSEYGDIDLELEFMMAKDSNSGIYFQGRYEMQLLDSWATLEPTSGDNGGIYERWDDSRSDGQKGYQGYPPRQNVSRAPGLWQHLNVSFQAPRFDDEGNKIQNAKIISATLNGVTIHEDVDLLGPTRGAIGNREVSQGPLRIQGDHGAIAFRNISIKHYNQPAPEVSNLQYQVFEGAFNSIPDIDSLSAVKSGSSGILTSSLGNLPDQFLLHYEGVISSPENGRYTLDFDPAGGFGILVIDGEEVISAENNQASVTLSDKEVPFELYYSRRANWADPNIGLSASASNMRTQLLSTEKFSGTDNTNPIYVEAKDKPLLRSFMDLPNGTRITHAVSVSNLDKLHYTYDLKSGNLVQVWRGRFLDATPMWYNRGDGSSRPVGTVEYLLEKPALVVNKLADRQSVWSSDTSGTGFQTKGYKLNTGNEPVFQYEIYGSSVEDKVRVIDGGKGVQRTLQLDNVSDSLYLRLASGKSIEKVGENRYAINDRSYYLDLNNTAEAEPFVRTVDGQQELILPAQSTTNYTILL